PTPRFGIHAFNIALFAGLNGRVDKGENKAIRADKVSDFIAGCAIWTYRGASHSPVVSNNLGCNISDTQNIGVTILFTKAEALRQLCSYHIAVQNSDLTPVLG